MIRSVHAFGAGHADGDRSMTALLGRKGAHLAEMSRLGLPVPPGFTVTTAVTEHYTREGRLPDSVREQLLTSLAHVETLVDRKFGSDERPLLLSVRAGARIPIPGLMPAILNLGMNQKVAESLGREAHCEQFAIDCFRRFITNYSDIVLGIHRDRFEHELDKLRSFVAKRRGIDASLLTMDEKRRAVADRSLEPPDLRRLVSTYQTIVRKDTGQPFPQDPHEQLFAAIGGALASWNSSRAKTFRKLHDIPDSWGIACTVQAMVFGNLGPESGAGVALSRDPATGRAAFSGEWIPGGQGNDLQTRHKLSHPLASAATSAEPASLDLSMPGVYRDLLDAKNRLETHFRDMLEIDFAVQEGRLVLLGCRPGQRSARAAVRIAVDLAKEGILTRPEALLRVDPTSIDQMLHATIDPLAPKTLLAKGLPAGPGAASGVVVFTAEEAVRQAETGKQVILVRVETSPEDMLGLKVASGVLTTRGGLTSHAAVVARGMGKCCVAGCSTLDIDYLQKKLLVAVSGAEKDREPTLVRAGDILTLDGTTGNVYLGSVPTIDASLTGEFGELMSWADEFRKMRVRANADIPRDAKTARAFGTDGIGLCRTEHMFFEKERIPWMVEMIMAKDSPARQKALAKLLPFQQEDFVGLFREMAGLPVTIRLLDPPLHEFMPEDEESVAMTARHLGVSCKEVERRVWELHEYNPMLGHRGCRLAITYPEIYEMQVQAILSAAIHAKREGIEVTPEIMIPFVATEGELSRLQELVRDTADRVFASAGMTIDYRYGTMIELPRAVLVADKLARSADFFSFGTNDLTQMVLALSRDDAGRFLTTYVDQGVLPVDPFQSVDIDGVGYLLKLGIERGRATRPDLVIGVCGEHGGDPTSIRFFHALGIDYVSCSPFRVPIARLAAAQAALAALASSVSPLSNAAGSG